MLNLALPFFISFLVGSLPTAYWAGKLLKDVDIRGYGSGNVGTTNAIRVLGKKTGVTVFLIDFAKGFLPVLCLPVFFSGGGRLSADEFRLWIGLAAILGHIFTPFLGFKGGKGVATGAGVLCAGFPALFLLTVAVWGVVFCIWRVVSASSVLAVASMVGFSMLLHESRTAVLAFSGVAVLIIWEHRTNLIRLMKGQEHRIGSDKS